MIAQREVHHTYVVEAIRGALGFGSGHFLPDEKCIGEYLEGLIVVAARKDSDAHFVQRCRDVVLVHPPLGITVPPSQHELVPHLGADFVDSHPCVQHGNVMEGCTDQLVSKGIAILREGVRSVFALAQEVLVRVHCLAVVLSLDTSHGLSMDIKSVTNNRVLVREWTRALILSLRLITFQLARNSNEYPLVAFSLVARRLNDSRLHQDLRINLILAAAEVLRCQRQLTDTMELHIRYRQRPVVFIFIAGRQIRAVLVFWGIFAGAGLFLCLLNSGASRTRSAGGRGRGRAPVLVAGYNVTPILERRG
mmetsp:Transcript_27866/g.81799  ORF Transcript_27866/g.81799 Transcript_27866/m.81799 type:complete len:307 (+) Transcript_27866:410-1330(+)